MPDRAVTAHVIDLAKIVPRQAERDRLVDAGAAFLAAGTSEDAAVRVAELTMELHNYLRLEHRRRGDHVSTLRLKLATIAFVTQCVRRRAELEGNNVRHVN